MTRKDLEVNLGRARGDLDAAWARFLRNPEREGYVDMCANMIKYRNRWRALQTMREETSGADGTDDTTGVECLR